MSETLFTETRLLLTALAQRESIHIATTWRWTTRGVRGHVLESFVCGGRRFTTEEAVRRWLALINGGKIVAGETPRQRERAIARAEKQLAKLGV